MVRQAVVSGINWFQVYYDEDGNLLFKRMPDYEIIPFWADADHTILDAVIRFYEIMEIKPSGDQIPHQKLNTIHLKEFGFMN